MKNYIDNYKVNRFSKTEIPSIKVWMAKSLQF